MVGLPDGAISHAQTITGERLNATSDNDEIISDKSTVFNHSPINGAPRFKPINHENSYSYSGLFYNSI